jgi:uracil phosphoribosyltransferase
MQNVTVVNHPLVQHKLSILRDKETSCGGFRRLLKELSMLLAYEVTRDLPSHAIEIETPVAKGTFRSVQGENIIIISILRAGNAILDGMLELLPMARVGHIGLYRDVKTLEPVEYYFKVPQNIEGGDFIIVDPMLATGNSAAVALEKLEPLKPRSMRLVTVVSCPEGIKRINDQFPNVPIFTAAIDEGLNDHGYIVPGLGDAGDRIFGTK